jgi:hypothetical protein
MTCDLEKTKDESEEVLYARQRGSYNRGHGRYQGQGCGRGY